MTGEKKMDNATNKRKKGIVIAVGVVVLVLGGAIAGHFLGFFNSVRLVTVLDVSGTVEIERLPDILTARAGMRLQNLDTIRTDSGSSSWLSLDDVKAVELAELTALHIDKQAQGFVLTLDYGEIKTQIDKPLAADEEFVVVAGELVLAVRGTIFTVALGNWGTAATVSVERGEVAVLNADGEEIATVKAGESRSFETGKLVEFGGYEWRVLEVNDGKALLLSEYIIEVRPYHRRGNWPDGITWEQCDLRAYLNSEFLNNFSERDRARIAETYVINNDNPWYGTEGGNDTTDKIFLLSIEEVVQYFGGSGQLANGNPNSTREIRDEYNAARIAHNNNGVTLYWRLRSPGGKSDNAAIVDIGGNIGVDGHRVYGIGGVRPALWLNL
jgi:hypothetical protein